MVLRAVCTESGRATIMNDPFLVLRDTIHQQTLLSEPANIKTMLNKANISIPLVMGSAVA